MQWDGRFELNTGGDLPQFMKDFHAHCEAKSTPQRTVSLHTHTHAHLAVRVQCATMTRTCVCVTRVQVLQRFHTACREAREDVVEWMCTHNANIHTLVNHKDRHSKSALDYACQGGNTHICDLLHFSGAKVCACMFVQCTVL